MSNAINWTNEHEKALQQIQAHFNKDRILRLPNLTKPFYLVTDWSLKYLGSCVMQKYRVNVHPICYGS